MRYRLVALLSAVLTALIVHCSAATAEEAKNDVKGLFLLTDYPSVTLRPGSTSTINLKLQNYGLPPERVALSVTGVPNGWTANLIGGGQPVGAALAATNASVALELRLEVPKEAPIGTTSLTVAAQGANNNVTLPVEVKLATDLPAKLTLTPQLPELRGTSKSNFEFQLAIKNDSPKKVVASLAATAPQFFDATFTEQYGSQELNALPLDPGQSKDVKLKIKPPNTVAANKYKIAAKVTAEDATASADLVVDITGQPKIDISGREGVLSTRASAGKEESVPVILTNSGTAAAEQIELSGTVPPGWKINFDPKAVDRIAPNETKEVKAQVTPSEKAVAGDYQATMRAQARGESASQNFRVQVTTSTIWGIVGIALIGGALLVMVGAVVWFGRR
ncbi:MAG: NEW3 domain-containing protein [Xanthobacteraceae bacterium]